MTYNFNASDCSKWTDNLYLFSTITEALEHFKCDVIVDMQLPCSHTAKLLCFEENDISRGKKGFPRCNANSHVPFVYPNCFHELICKCWQAQDWAKNPSKVKACKQNVDYLPDCSHDVSIECHLKQKYDKKEFEFVCKKILDVTLPRYQFYQHLTGQFFLQKCFLKFFSNYSLALIFFGERILA